jgi:hypothetical protein
MIYQLRIQENPLGLMGFQAATTFFHHMGMSHGLDNGFDIL